MPTPIEPGAPTVPVGETIRRASDAFDRPHELPALSIDLRAVGGASTTAVSVHDLEVHAVLGEGGMGRVMLARQRSLGRDVAVKTAKPDATDGDREAILTEGFVTGQLEHPGIVPVHALGLDATGWPALVMKRVEGVSWDELVRDPAHPGWEGWEGTPADRLAGHLQVLVSVCNALDFAHSRGVVHCDLKPANVLIGRFGDVYLADWGIATRSGVSPTGVVGTPAYLAPELLGEGVVDARTDVYLLGATLHEVLTGAPRHTGRTLPEALEAARRSAPASYPPSVAPELASLANRACAKSPADRPAGARAFRDELTQYLRYQQARALAAKAEARVVEVERLELAGTAEARAKVDVLAAEARFGLVQALEQVKHVPAEQALARLDAVLERRRARSEALEREAHERNPLLGARPRLIGVAVMIALTVGAGVLVQRMGEPTQAEIVAFPAVILGLLLVSGLAFRRQLLLTRYDRQMFACVLTPLALMTLARVASNARALSVHEHFIRDAFIFSAVWAAAAIISRPWTWAVAVAFAIDGVVTIVEPRASVWGFIAATVISLVASGVATWRDQMAPPGSGTVT